jgi:hypothetical protein
VDGYESTTERYSCTGRSDVHQKQCFSEICLVKDLDDTKFLAIGSNLYDKLAQNEHLIPVKLISTIAFSSITFASYATPLDLDRH